MAAKRVLKQPKTKPRTRGKRGPEAETVKIEGDWEEAMKKALKAPPRRKGK
jgi:hypothetical protein